MPEIETPQIPDRLYFRIGDVADLAGVEPYVLRFWETEFPMLQPKKAKSGHREYRRKDVELILEIKRLLYSEGFTIPGARKSLQERSRRKRPGGPEQAGLQFGQPPSKIAPALNQMRKEVQEMLEILKRRK